MTGQWEKIAADLHGPLLDEFQSKVARRRGNEPSRVFVKRRVGTIEIVYVAMQYLEPGKWERWMIRMNHNWEIAGTWSQMMELLRPLIRDRTAIELYPRECDTVNRAPVRHFWILPDGIQPEFDLRG